MLKTLTIFDGSLNQLPVNKKLLINTINAHSYNVALNDPLFKKCLSDCDVLIPDGVSIVLAKRVLSGKRIKKIAGFDLFTYEMTRLNTSGGKCFFLGSSLQVLTKMCERAGVEYPNVTTGFYSPPYKPVFSDAENDEMIQVVNTFEPDVLFVGMTAPKQEKWAFQQFDKLNATHIGCIGAVFDFYAGTVKRAPQWMISLGLEWFFRLIKEPKRMWRRYLIGNIQFVYNIIVYESLKGQPR
jgi:N-acetylglucosaminyldiphosphoundecaprenol N-acetyl-beta-D-mannosaminyltransferase